MTPLITDLQYCDHCRHWHAERTARYCNLSPYGDRINTVNICEPCQQAAAAKPSPIKAPNPCN